MADPPTQVSIVIPAYNHARYLSEAIESVLQQDYPGVELIVIDDGSTDATQQVLQSYGDRFAWWTQPNGGQSRTLNAGWNRSRGDVLGYLSADDRLSPAAVRRAVEVLDARPDVSVVYSDYDLIDPLSRRVRTVRTRDFDLVSMVANVDCTVGPGAFFRRSAFEQSGGWSTDLRQSPDLDYWFRVAMIGEFQRIPEVLAGFRVHEESQTFAVADTQRAEEALVIIERLFARTDVPERLIPYRARAMGLSHVRAARQHFRGGRLRQGLRSMSRAARIAPTSLLTVRAMRLLVNAVVARAGHRLLWRVRPQDRSAS